MLSVSIIVFAPVSNPSETTRVTTDNERNTERSLFFMWSQYIRPVLRITGGNGEKGAVCFTSHESIASSSIGKENSVRHWKAVFLAEYHSKWDKIGGFEIIVRPHYSNTAYKTCCFCVPCPWTPTIIPFLSTDPIFRAFFRRFQEETPRCKPRLEAKNDEFFSQ